MNFKLVIFLFLGIIISTAHAEGIQDIEKRNEAAGFAGTLKFFIGRAARDCKPYLEKDSQWMNGVVQNWMNRNGEYARASEAWMSAYLTFIAQEKGMVTGQVAKQELLKVITSNANAMTSEIVKGNETQKIQGCSDFERNVASGKYDITKDSPYFTELESLVATVN